jgi:hypothetical protein
MNPEQIYQESLRGFEETGDRWEQTGPLRSLGHLAWMQGEYELATRFYTRSIALCQGMRGAWFLTRGLEGLARVVCAQGDFPRGHPSRCCGETTHRLGSCRPTHCAPITMTRSVSCMASLSSQAFEEAWRLGSSMSREQSMVYALGSDSGSLSKRPLR